MSYIVISPLKTIAEQAIRHNASEMISLMTESHDFHRPGVINPERHLRIGVNDVDVDANDGLIAPSDHHVAAIIDFAKGWNRKAPLIVHCWMGVSRSPAAALIAALSVAPQLEDDDLAKTMRAASPQASPNSLIIEIGDRLLGRHGRLVQAIKAIGPGADYQGDAPFQLHF